MAAPAQSPVEPPSGIPPQGPFRWSPSGLLVLCSALGIPAAILGAVWSLAGPFLLLTWAGLTCTALADRQASRNRFASLRLQHPGVVRLARSRDGEIAFTLRTGPSTHFRLTVGPEFPAGLTGQPDTVDVRISGSGDVSFTVAASRRGVYRIPAIHLETTSRFGLWKIRAACPIDLKVRVFPDFGPVRRQLAGLFLNRGYAGIHRRRLVGRGREFEKLREYIPGDDFQDIHWKATAKRGRPITQVYQVERTQEIYLIVDSSRLMGRPLGTDPDDTVMERALVAATALGMAAERQGDLFGLVAFSDRIERFLRARSGHAQRSAFRDALFGLEARRVPPQFDELFIHLRTALRRRALLIFLTDLSDAVIASDFVAQAPLVARQHLCLVNMVRPPEAHPLFAAGAGEAVSGTDPNDLLYERLGGHLQWRKLRETSRQLRRWGIDFSAVADERLAVEAVNQYLAAKQRQRL